MRIRKTVVWTLLLAWIVAGVLVAAAQARPVATGKFTAVAMDTPTARTSSSTAAAAPASGSSSLTGPTGWR